MVRVRIAPSPTGIPHIGNTRTALFNYLFAKHNQGKFILRIEDTDQKRIVPGAKEAIVEILTWLGLFPDEQYTQSERLSLYKEHAELLIKKAIAYKKDGAVWVRVNTGAAIAWDDAIGNKKIQFNSNDIEDFVVLKSDGFPTYHLASVVDDHLTEISHVIRGQEWISSTPKHLFLYESFGWKSPIFAHLPVILGPDKAKLSKRHGAKSVLDYRDEGYLKEALLNFMVILGWSPGGDKEIMSMDEMAQLFDLKNVNTANPIFDIGKLQWLNGVYIRQLGIDELSEKIKNKNEKLKRINEKIFKKLVELAQSRMKTLNEFDELVAPIVEEPKVVLSQNEKELARKLKVGFSSIVHWESNAIFTTIKKVMQEAQVRMPVMYRIMTGKESGLPLPQVLEIIGKEKVLERLEKLL